MGTERREDRAVCSAPGRTGSSRGPGSVHFCLQQPSPRAAPASGLQLQGPCRAFPTRPRRRAGSRDFGVGRYSRSFAPTRGPVPRQASGHRPATSPGVHEECRELEACAWPS